MNQPVAQMTDAGEWQATLLFVDDEPNILNALKRLFRPLGYRIFIAESGKAGLEFLEREKIELVVSDMRMPEMDGAKFLEQVRNKWPDTVRFLLTGYADVGSTIAAVNSGGIYRYISKPWNENDIVLAVREVLERKRLEQEKHRLEELTQQQNEQLKDLNANLDNKVKARTEELRQTVGFLEVAHKSLKKNFLISLKVFSNLMELREGAMAGHSRRVTEHARGIAQHLNLKEEEVQDITFAALLHDIGKIGLPDRLLHKPFATLSAEERLEVIKHPAAGEAALMALENLRGAARLIRGHHERYDGMGYPDGLAGLGIPLGARILAVANDYDAAQADALLSKKLTPAEALLSIREGRGKRYDPKVVDVFVSMVGQAAKPVSGGLELKLPTTALKIGMVLSRDLLAPQGFLLLSRYFQLDDALIGQILDFEEREGRPLTVYVRAAQE